LEHNLHNLSTNLSPERVKHFRKDNGWSQDLLAKASGLSLRTIQRAEKDGNSSAETQLSLAAAFNISPKDLFHISSTPDVNWKRKSIMQSFLALLVVVGAIVMLFVVGGSLTMFSDYHSALFLFLFMYAATVVAFGSHGLLKSILGLKYIFASDINPSPATEFIAIIYKKQITFVYGGALIGLLIGLVAINAGFDQIDKPLELHAAYAVCLLVLLYAAIFAEGLLRPLSTKLEQRRLVTTFDNQA